MNEVQGGPAPKSTGVTVLGVVMIVFGGLGLLSGPSTLLSRELGKQTGSGRIQELMWSGAFGTWMFVALGIGTLMALLLLASGIGVLRRQSWARKAGLAYGIAGVVFGVVGQMVNILFLYPKLAAFEGADAAERGGAIGGIVGGVVGGLFGMVLPIVLWVAMTRPTIKEELSG
jgi:hypothetical protein